MSATAKQDEGEARMKPRQSPAVLALMAGLLTACGPGTPTPPILPPIVEVHDAEHDPGQARAILPDHKATQAADETTMPAPGSPPHHHGAAEAVIVLEAGQLKLDFISPMANFLPFEHAPRTDAEIAALSGLMTALAEADALIRPSPQAGCQHRDANLTTERTGDHTTLLASYIMDCRDLSRLTALTLSGFETYTGLQDVDLVVLGPDGQRAASLTPQAPTLMLER